MEIKAVEINGIKIRYQESEEWIIKEEFYENSFQRGMLYAEAGE